MYHILIDFKGLIYQIYIFIYMIINVGLINQTPTKNFPTVKEAKN